MMLIAHAAHFVTTVLYLVPVLAFLVWLLLTQLRERRARRKT
jgi:hypothetical protein